MNLSIRHNNVIYIISNLLNLLIVFYKMSKAGATYFTLNDPF